MVLLLSGWLTSSCRAPQPAVHEEQGLCPFECCTYRTWLAQRESSVLAERRDDAPVAFVVREGEEVDGLTGVVLTLRPGSVVVRSPVRAGALGTPLKPGDSVDVLVQTSSGEWKYTHNGKQDRARIPGRGVSCFNDNRRVECDWEIAEEPVTVWWARIRNHLGQEGWTRQTDDYTNMDGCS